MVQGQSQPYRYGISQKELGRKKAAAPVLENRHRKYFLRFSYTEEVLLTKAPAKEQVICSVDLGLNTDAVCTIMRADGTVLGRKFIDFSSEKDRMYRVLGRISRFQREHGSVPVKSRWAYAKRLNTELGRKIAGTVVRDPGNHSLCTFRNGKRYNCDLSASYNLGARYFIRELLNPLPATERSLLEAKVPSVKRRISCVYADLRELFLEMELLRAA